MKGVKRRARTVVREYVFYVFFENEKKRDFTFYALLYTFPGTMVASLPLEVLWQGTCTVAAVSPCTILEETV